MMPKLIDELLAGRRPAGSALQEVFHQILDGEADPVQVAGLLVALRAVPPDGETLATLASALRARRVPVNCQVRPLIDTCGTGGDGAGTFNISTAAALVVAACGGAVAKHGNRSVSSQTGSADVLEALGVKLDTSPVEAARNVDAVGFAFLFAPRFHPLMAHVMPVRRSLGVRTHFNLVGPLSNPALAEFQVLGVFAPELCPVMADALLRLGTRAALVIHCAGLDEIGLHDVTHGQLVRDGKLHEFELDPSDLGLARAPLEALAGGDARENARIMLDVLEGAPGPRQDVVALNAGAACYVSGLAPSIAEGFEQARAALQDGRALRVLERSRETGDRKQKVQEP